MRKETIKTVELRRPEEIDISALIFQITKKGWLAIAELKSLSLFIPISLMLKKAFDNVEIEK